MGGGEEAAAAAAECAEEEGELLLLAFLAFLGGFSLEDSSGWSLFVPLLSVSTCTPAAPSFSLLAVEPLNSSCCCGCCSSSSSFSCSALRRLSEPSPLTESLWDGGVELMGREGETQDGEWRQEAVDEMLSGQSRLSCTRGKVGAVVIGGGWERKEEGGKK